MLQHTKLTNITQLSSSVLAIYSNPESTKTHIKGFLIHNTDTSEQSTTLYWVQSGSSYSASNQCFKLNIDPDETVILEIPYGIVMTDVSESIMGNSTVSSKVNIAVFGDKDS